MNKKQQIYIIFEAHNRIDSMSLYKSITRLMQRSTHSTTNFDSPIRHVSFKKKNKASFTVISGPHVHKKSRDQYKIESYKGFFAISVLDDFDFFNFLEFKRKLYASYSDQYFNISISYLGSDKLILHNKSKKWPKAIAETVSK